MAKPSVSIIIPAYNEAQRLPETLMRVLEFACSHQWNAEILVVDDGSTDRTAAVVQSFMERFPELHLIQNPGNRGKGYSVRNGILQAKNEMVMFADADLSVPIDEADLLMQALQDGADVAIGSRWLDPARQTKHQPLYRRFFGRCFNAITRAVMNLSYADTQCGFKAFRREAAQVIFRLQRVERWGFDPELLFIAQRMGFRVREVAVSCSHDERSRISFIKDGAKMLEELAAIRLNSFLGRYEPAIANAADTSGMVTPFVRNNCGPRHEAVRWQPLCREATERHTLA